MKTLALATTIGLIAAGCSAPTNPAGETEEKETPVQVAPVTVGSLTLDNQIIGTTNPSSEADVVPKMSGELVQLNVAKDDYVTKGSLLGRIDNEDLRIQLELAKLTLEQAQTQYKTTFSQTDDTVQLESARSNVEQARLRVEQAENSMGNTDITAPISGIIVSAGVETGQFVSAGSPLFKIVSLQPIRVTANVSANQMLALQKQGEIEVTLPDIGQTANAAISYLSPVADSAGFYTIEAEIDNENGEIKSGMTALFPLRHTLVSDALLVPTRAIIEKGGQSYVFAVANGQAVETPVEVLEAQSDVTAVTGELKEGDQVVVRGQLTLSDGGKVRVVEEAQ